MERRLSAATDEERTIPQAANTPGPPKINGARRHVVVIGGGFGGLACAGELVNGAARVTLIDRRNHNLFQPLLYQVATAALSPADIAEPIRRTLGRARNIEVRLGEVTGIDVDARSVLVRGQPPISFDYLVIATGSDYNYFGRDDWRELAPGLKTIREARQIRQRLLTAFEKAEMCDDAAERRALLTAVVIGGGPTGVEMAGAISELGRFMVGRDFRNIHPDDLRVVLVEAGPRILASFPEDLATYAHDYLTRIGVEILTGQRVTEIHPDGVSLGDRHLAAGTIVWGAGVKASSAATWLGLENEARGHIPVGSDLAVPGLERIYAIGDTARSLDEDGKPLPALAQVARQQGIHLGRAIRRNIERGEPFPAFHFHNRGNTAVVGRNAAVFDFGSWRLKGRLAWFLWAIVHVYLLINFEKRLLVSLQWIWRYMTRQRGARLIDEDVSLYPRGQEAKLRNARSDAAP